MVKPTVIVGLDIGSSKVSGVVAEAGKGGLLSILGHAMHSSGGIVRGEIVDLNEAADAVSEVMSRLAGRFQKLPRDIYVNVSGQTIRGEKARGMIPLSLRGREITRSDMARCVNTASTLRLPLDREIIHKVVHNFSIDDQPWIKNPLGLYASRLACEIYVITSGINHIQNIYKCVNNAGYNVKELVFTALADGAALLETGEKEEGIGLLDTGASLSAFAIFHGGELRDMEVMPIGLEDMKDDIANNKGLVTLIEKVRQRIDESLMKGLKIGSVKLAGGIVFNDTIVDLLSGKIPYPVKVASPKDIKGEISSLDALKATTAIGVVKHVCEKMEARPIEEGNILNRISSGLVDIINNYF